MILSLRRHLRPWKGRRRLSVMGLCLVASLLVPSGIAEARDPFFALVPLKFRCIFRTLYGKNPTQQQDNDMTPSSPGECGESATKTQQSVTQYLAGAQCGGSSTKMNETVVRGAGEEFDAVAVVSGVPGRDSEIMGNVLSGMAKRVETGGADGTGFKSIGKNIPIWGLGTVCPMKTKTMKKELKDGMKDVAAPYFEDPPCQWKGGVLNQKPMSLQGCKEFCDWVNTFTYKDKKGVERFLCNDAPVLGGNKDYSRNCEVLLDNEYHRCDDQKNKTCKRGGPDLKNLKSYRSFVRFYDKVSAERKKIKDVPNDAMSSFKPQKTEINDNLPVPNPKNIQVACYGFYDEFDTKTRRTETKDQRCVISMPVDWNTIQQRQQGRGTYFDQVRQKDGPEFRNKNFNALTDIWYPNIGAAVSFLSEYASDKNLSTALLTRDVAEQTSSNQTWNAAQPLALKSTLRATDDTVSNERQESRPFTRWWQQFQTDAHRLTTPPTVHLRLPSNWTYRLDGLQPLAVQAFGSGASPLQSQAIDVQLKANEDLLGTLSAFLTQALLLPVTEEPVPVVVPLGSPVEFYAYAQRWEEWKTTRKKAKLLTSSEEKTADEFIAKYLQYAEQIEDVRILRGELARVTALVLEREKDMYRAIHSWVIDNGKIYKQYLDNAQKRRELQQTWEDIKLRYAYFQDYTQAQWCRSDRFTTPIYSLLDPWLPGRPGLFGGIPSCAESAQPVPSDKTTMQSLPILCIPQQERDLVVDFSSLKVGTGSLRIPVLKPVQIRIAPILPGSFAQKPPDAASVKLPDLPRPIILDDKKIQQILPAIQQDRNPLKKLEEPPAFSIDGAKNTLLRAKAVIEGMDEAYRKFWASLDAPRNVCNIAAPGQQPKYVALKPLECCGWGKATCAHSEMDLRERIQRIVARPGVLLLEDQTNIGIPRTVLPPGIPLTPKQQELWYKRSATCWPDDHTCAEPQPERWLPRAGMQLLAPSAVRTQASQDPIEQIRQEQRETTIGPSGTFKTNGQGQPPPYIVPPQQTYPVFGVPPPVKLTP